MLVAVLLILGLLLIFVEFYVPGAIMGTLGGLLVFSSAVIFALDAPIWATILYIGCVVFIIKNLISFAMWKIQHTKPSKSIYSHASQEGFIATSFDLSLIGHEGIVATDLKPGGSIDIEGKRLQAISQGEYLVKGTKVIVIGGEGDALLVKSKKEK